MKNKNLSYINNLYAIGTILVIVGHSHLSDWNRFAGTSLETLIQFIYCFHMALYFLLQVICLCTLKVLNAVGMAVGLKINYIL